MLTFNLWDDGKEKILGISISITNISVKPSVEISHLIAKRFMY